MVGVRPELRPVAWGDESLNHDQTLYILSAAIYTNTRAARYISRRLEMAAHSFGQTGIHAIDATAAELDAYEKIIADDRALIKITTVQTPIRDVGGMENARQRCLAELATRLVRLGVRQLTLDSRDDLHHQQTGRPRGNDRDRKTIRALKSAPATVHPDFRLMHADDKDDHCLWIPDVIAYASYRALCTDDPARLKNLATADMHIYPAEQLPDRAGEGEPLREPNRELGLALARIRVAAQLAHAVELRNSAYAKVDPNQAMTDPRLERELKVAVAGLSAAKDASDRVAKSIRDFEYSHHRVRAIRQMVMGNREGRQGRM